MAANWLKVTRRGTLAAALAAASLATAPAALAADPVETLASRVGSGCLGADSTPYIIGVLQARAATLCLVNIERSKRGLVRLTHDGDLALAAAHHAADMVRRDYFRHTDPDGATYVDRILDTDYVDSPGDRWTLGENIGWGKRDSEATPRQIVKAWMRSTTHRGNILDERFENAGVAIALGGPKPGFARAATWDMTFGVLRQAKR